MEYPSFLNEKVTIQVGDITKERVDVIVNAANSTLLGGGGVDGAVHRAGGDEIYRECWRIRQTEYPKGLPAGQAVITTGGKLPAPFVIHTVGPVYGRHEGKEAELLAECYRNSLQLALSKELKTIAFPAISTGAFSYPRHEAARVSSRAISDFLRQNEGIQEVRLVFFDGSDAGKFIKHQVF